MTNSSSLRSIVIHLLNWLLQLPVWCPSYLCVVVVTCRLIYLCVVVVTCWLIYLLTDLPVCCRSYLSTDLPVCRRSYCRLIYLCVVVVTCILMASRVCQQIWVFLCMTRLKITFVSPKNSMSCTVRWAQRSSCVRSVRRMIKTSALSLVDICSVLRAWRPGRSVT